MASARNTYPSIDAEYEPKAESFETIDSFIENNGQIIPYLISTQFVYFIAALALVITAFIYIFCYENTKSSKTSFIKRILKTKESKNLKSSGDLEKGTCICKHFQRCHGRQSGGNTPLAQGEVDRQPPAPLTEGGGDRQPPAPLTEGGGDRQPPAPLTEGGGDRQPPAPLTEGGGDRQPPAPLTEGGGDRQPPAPLTEGGGDRQPPAPLTEGGGDRQPPAPLTEGGGDRQPPTPLTEGGGDRQPPAPLTEGGGDRQPPAPLTEGGGDRQPPAPLTEGGGDRQPPARGPGPDSEEALIEEENREPGSKVNIGKDNKKSEEEKLYEEWHVKSTLIMHFVLSMVLSLFIVLMSIIAASHGTKLAKNEHSEIKEIFNFMENSLKPLFVLTYLILAQDVFLFILSGGLILGLFCYKGDDKWWVLCIFSPVCPIAHILVHFTHIVIGFIHNEHHATSVGLFYVGAVILQVLMFKVVSHMYFTCFYLKDTLSDVNCCKRCIGSVMNCCMGSIMNCCCWNCWGLRKYLNRYIIFGMVYFALSVILFGLVAFVAGLYILLPINNAFDEAPDRLNTVISGIALLIGGYIIYLLKNLRKDNANANKKEN